MHTAANREGLRRSPFTHRNFAPPSGQTEDGVLPLFFFFQRGWHAR